MKSKLFEGRYYMNHFITNIIIVYYTFSCMINSYSHNKIDILTSSSINIVHELISALHLYHILWYYNNLRKDDWIHHILMIGIVIPLTYMSPIGYYNMIGHGIFFLTGLPGAIDYLLLFLVRNNIIHRNIEKTVNCLLNQWIRCPGCISNCTLILYNYNTLESSRNDYYELFSIYLIVIIIYWNGVYFMNQVVDDYIRQVKLKQV